MKNKIGEHKNGIERESKEETNKWEVEIELE